MHSKSLQTGLLLLTLLAYACGGKKENAHVHHHEREDVWKEMDAFHLVMQETFHPYKDSSNLEPARSRASELMAAADKWASAPLPARVDNQMMESRLDELRSEAARLAESVKSPDDNAIGERLTELHDTFHEIEEAWYRTQ
jgi:hypothetical protein